MNSIGWGLTIASISHIRFTTLELILRSGNIMSVFLGYYLINEVVTKWDIFSLIGTFFAMILILKPKFIFGFDDTNNLHQEDKPIGIILAFSCAIVIAVANVLTKKLTDFFHPVYIILVIGFSSIIFGIISIQISNLSYQIEYSFFIYIVLASLIEFFSYYFIFKSFECESVTKLSPFFNSRIVFAVLLTFFLYGKIDILDSVGTMTIISIYTFSWYKKLIIV